MTGRFPRAIGELPVSRPFDMHVAEFALKCADFDPDEAQKLMDLWSYRPQIARQRAANEGYRVFFPEGGEK